MEAWPDYKLSNLNKFANSYPDPNHNPNPNPNPNPKIFFLIYPPLNPDHNTTWSVSLLCLRSTLRLYILGIYI